MLREYGRNINVFWKRKNKSKKHIDERVERGNIEKKTESTRIGEREKCWKLDLLHFMENRLCVTWKNVCMQSFKIYKSVKNEWKEIEKMERNIKVIRIWWITVSFDTFIYSYFFAVFWNEIKSNWAIGRAKDKWEWKWQRCAKWMCRRKRVRERKRGQKDWTNTDEWISHERFSEKTLTKKNYEKGMEGVCYGWQYLGIRTLKWRRAYVLWWCCYYHWWLCLSDCVIVHNIKIGHFTAL